MEWTCPECGGGDRVIVTEPFGAKTNRCLAPSCGFIEPWAPEPEENDA